MLEVGVFLNEPPSWMLNYQLNGALERARIQGLRGQEEGWEGPEEEWGCLVSRSGMLGGLVGG